MLIKKSGIFKTIDSKDFGIYQKQGWEKVINEPLPKLEEVKPKPIEEEIVTTVENEQPIKEVAEEIVIPKSKKKK